MESNDGTFYEPNYFIIIKNEWIKFFWKMEENQ